MTKLLLFFFNIAIPSLTLLFIINEMKFLLQEKNLSESAVTYLVNGHALIMTPSLFNPIAVVEGLPDQRL